MGVRSKLATRTAAVIVAALLTGLASAVADLTEWDSPGGSDAAFRAFDTVLQNEIPIETVLSRSPATPSLRDDRPINEYYALRRRWH